MGKKKVTSSESVGEKVNPHIIACLTELEKEARLKGIDKLRLTYSKALRSAQRYPLPLRSGQEARTLEGVGPVLAKKIDDYLNKFGLLEHANDNDTHPSSDQEKDQQPTKRKTTKKYVPKFKSAAWAIVITLYRHSKNNSNPKMTKSDLIAAAASLTDTPMLLNGGGKFQYCGWSCMSGLIDKYGLVHCGGRPKRFELTHSGRRLARKLHIGAKEMMNEEHDGIDFQITDDEGSDNETEEEKKNSKRQKNEHVAKKGKNDNSQEDIIIDLLSSDEDDSETCASNKAKKKILKLLTPASASTNVSKMSLPMKLSSFDDNMIESQSHLFTVTYVNSSHVPVQNKDESKVQISHATGLSFMVRITVSHPSNMVHIIPRVDIVEKTEGCQMLAYIRDEQAPDKSSSLLDNIFPRHILEKCMIKDVTLPDSVKKMVGVGFETPNSIAQMLVKSSTDIDDAYDSKVPLTKQKAKFTDEQVAGLSSRSNFSKKEEKTKEFITQEKLKESKRPENGKKRKKEESYLSDEEQPKKIANILDFRQFTKKIEPQKAPPKYKLFSPHYKLTMIVDQRERHNNDRNYFISTLSKHIDCKSIQLSLGDVVWVASDHEGEYLLDFVIERKIIDDLAGSIIDGRYKEQRFRLRESKMGTIMYLIEGDLKSNQRLPPHILENALVRLLVSDGFLIKRTANIDATVQFLVAMTNMIRDMLDKDGINSHISKFRDLANFNFICSKNKCLAEKEIFGRQLCCVPGVSAQIAETILESYKTPRAFNLAFEDKREGLLSDVVVKSKFLGVAARKIGPACSKSLYQMYTKEI